MRQPAPTARRRAAEWGFHLATGYAVWIALTQRLAPSEVVVGAPVAILAAVASHLVWSQNGATFAGTGRLLLTGWQVVPYAVTGTLEILGVLARKLAGRPAPSLLCSARFDVGGAGPRAQARRALAIAYTSMTPNFIVLGVDREHGLLWYHQLERSDVPDMTRKLGARP
jgi:hypothetical protein